VYQSLKKSESGATKKANDAHIVLSFSYNGRPRRFATTTVRVCKASAVPKHSNPRRPIRGTLLPVFGRAAGAASATATGAGAAVIGSSISIAACTGAGGVAGGGGGAIPVTLRVLWATTSGVSVTTIAETTIPFLSAKTSRFAPST